MITIHGGPEGQSLPIYQGANNYYLNELGVAIIYPNVRGSEGYGKTFLAADNGMKREESVRDIGALLDWIAQQPDLDARRVMITGGSYGGYMTRIGGCQQRPHTLRGGYSRHFELQYFFKEYRKLPPRPAQGGVWRRKRYCYVGFF